MSHLRQVGATGATRGRGREAGAQEGGTGRRLFLIFLGVFGIPRRSLVFSGRRLREHTEANFNQCAVEVPSRLMFMIGIEGIGRRKKEHTGDTREGGGFDESGEEQGRGIGQLLTHFALSSCVFFFALSTVRAGVTPGLEAPGVPSWSRESRGGRIKNGRSREGSSAGGREKKKKVLRAEQPSRRNFFRFFFSGGPILSKTCRFQPRRPRPLLLSHPTSASAVARTPRPR